MFRKLILFIALALVFSMVIPYRAAPQPPTAEKRDAAAIAAATVGEDLSLNRQLQLTGDETLYAVSAYVYGLPTDRLAAAQGLQEPTCVTFYFDGLRYLGATTTYDGAGEYFDLQGRSAAQLDGMTDEQFLQVRDEIQAAAKEKRSTLSQNIHNFIMNVSSYN